MPQFVRTSNGRYKVFLSGENGVQIWIGTIAPAPYTREGSPGPVWWFVPRGGAGHVTHTNPQDAMHALEREYAH